MEISFFAEKGDHERKRKSTWQPMSHWLFHFVGYVEFLFSQKNSQPIFYSIFNRFLVIGYDFGYDFGYGMPLPFRISKCYRI